MKRNINYNDEEINLIDIIKIFYKYRILIIFGTILIVALSVFLTFLKNKRGKYVASSYIAVFNLSEDRKKTLENEVNLFLHSNEVIKKIKDKIGSENLMKFLNCKSTNAEIIKKNWESQVNFIFSENKLVTKSYNKNLALKINLLLLNELSEYLTRNIKEMIYEIANKLSSNSKINFVITTSSFPYHKVLFRATEDSTIKEQHTSLIKVLIISFIGSIFIMIFLVFIIEFFKKVDWQNLKRELK